MRFGFDRCIIHYCRWCVGCTGRFPPNQSNGPVAELRWHHIWCSGHIQRFHGGAGAKHRQLLYSKRKLLLIPIPSSSTQYLSYAFFSVIAVRMACCILYNGCRSCRTNSGIPPIWFSQNSTVECATAKYLHR